MIAEAQQQALQHFIGAKQVEWSQYVPGRQWDKEALATEIASDARFAEVQLCGTWYGPNETEIRDILSPILAYAGYGPDLAVVSAAIALACHKRRVKTNPVLTVVDGIAGLLGKG
ncbi:hypothetical protein K6U06_12560 [Acidiferrimicrobium sp. IK]|uniref:hypothetical protein n=1 Tax=Acidiferrimicrobium sp. IK TaxID=2871700 RepID=UPI0021CB08A2|nr:hypothetical protein [Acidiferrimicrobium sp. IK]MCU4185198.1 hypothetical protein [Acidiferrimicrobium sp. IK]